MPFFQNLSLSVQRFSPHRTLKTAKKEASYSPLTCPCSGSDPSALLPYVYPASLKEQIPSKFPVTFDAKCHATSEHSECIACLGKAYAEAMLTETSCSVSGLV